LLQFTREYLAWNQLGLSEPFYRPIIQGPQSTQIDLHQALDTHAPPLRCAAFVAMVKAADLRDSDGTSACIGR
jgi:hypothetical protein